MTSLTAIGIDLGTTYSAMAIVNEHGRAELIPNSDSDRLTPSAVFFDDDLILVGQEAKDKALTHPQQVALFVKRQMGKPNGVIFHRQQILSAVDVSALIIKKLCADAAQQLGRPVTHALITVPAHFDDARRRLTSEAGRIAGIEVLGIVNEPTAAAIAYGMERAEQAGTLLVYDLGGGTFDVTVLRAAQQEITVLASKGDAELGGKDFDDKLIELAVDRFKQEHGIDPTSDPRDAGDLRSSAEKIKRELSKRNKALMVVRAQGRSTQLEVTRSQFEDLIRPRIKTTFTIIALALQDAGLTPDQIDQIVLVGGSTRIPLISTLLRQTFGDRVQIQSNLNPDETVALGAALLAAQKIVDVSPQAVSPQVADVVGGLVVTDVLSHSIGIEASYPGTQQTFHSILIKRNTPLPAEVAREFATVQPGQTAIEVKIYQGETQNLVDCNPIGSFVLGGLPPDRPAGCKVRVSFRCDTDGVAHMTAVDIQSGLETTTTVGYKVGQSSEQISARQRWLEEQDVE